MLSAELERLKNAQGILAKEIRQKESVAGLCQAAEDALKERKLSRSVVDVLIEKVCVYPGNRIEIRFVFGGSPNA